MKKIFPLMIVMALVISCAPAKTASKAEMAVQPALEPVKHVVQPVTNNLEKFISDTVGLAGDSVEKILKPTYGYTYLILAVELNSNISSLLIDKTKEKIIGWQSQVATKLTPGNFIFVIPPKIFDGEKYRYDEELGRMIRNYLAVGKYGIPVSNPNDADYIVVTSIRESLSKSYGLNYSEISFSIMDKMDIPAYLASIRVESHSDRNFWYYATKKARPVKELTIKGLTRIMAEGLPDAHGNVNALVAYAKSIGSKDAAKAEKEN